MPAKDKTTTINNLFLGPLLIAKDQIIYKELKTADERCRFNEAIYSARELATTSQQLFDYLTGLSEQQVPGGPHLAYTAQKHLNRCLSALDYILGARQAHLAAKRSKRGKKDSK